MKYELYLLSSLGSLFDTGAKVECWIIYSRAYASVTKNTIRSALVSKRDPRELSRYNHIEMIIIFKHPDCYCRILTRNKLEDIVWFKRCRSESLGWIGVEKEEFCLAYFDSLVGAGGFSFLVGFCDWWPRNPRNSRAYLVQPRPQAPRKADGGINEQLKL